jgi:glycosyltransferase involved in cell wall biosynthesis
MERKESALPPRAWKYLRSIENADILVGIPSFNNAHTINYVAYQAARGLQTFFPDIKSVILVSDGNSTDGTLQTAEAIRLPFRGNIVATTYEGIPGKGSAVKAIFEAGSFLEVKAVALVDSDLRSITPDWIQLLVSPILAGTGFVAPFYLRHKYDGTITNLLCYPVTSSLFGKRIRQPIGGDFGLSIELVRTLLKSPLWQTSYVPRFGIDIFETHTALAENLKVKQAFLGTKIHEAKDPATHLAPMFRQVVGSMFTTIDHYQNAWRKIRGNADVEIIGNKRYTGTPEEIQVDLQGLVTTYADGFHENEQIYRKILTSDLFAEARRSMKRTRPEVSFSSETWAKIVFLFAARFREEETPLRERLLDALRILWIGKLATYVRETLELDAAEAEKRVDEEARVFEELKPFMLDVF